LGSRSPEQSSKAHKIEQLIRKTISTKIQTRFYITLEPKIATMYRIYLGTQWNEFSWTSIKFLADLASFLDSMHCKGTHCTRIFHFPCVIHPIWESFWMTFIIIKWQLPMQKIGTHYCKLWGAHKYWFLYKRAQCRSSNFSNVFSSLQFSSFLLIHVKFWPLYFPN